MAEMVPGQEAATQNFQGVVEMPDGTFAFRSELEKELKASLLSRDREDDSHYDNILDDLDTDTVKYLATEVIDNFEDDEASRSDWRAVYEKGLKLTNPEDMTDNNRLTRRLSKVQHPLILEAAVGFQARAINEMLPPEGPAGTKIVGEVDEEKRDQADRVRAHLNFQITEEMEDYYEEEDQMYFHLPLVGHTFKKISYNDETDTNDSKFIEAEDVVVDYSATSIQSAARVTHVLRYSQHEFERLVDAEFYADVPIDPSAVSEKAESVSKKLEGRTAASLNPKDYEYVLLEQQVYLTLDEDDQGVEYSLPYIVTVDYSTQQVLRVCRNWLEDDDSYQKREWFVSYKFLPGLGFYGYGLYHAIGGLNAAATGALRSLLDSAAFANLQGGVKLKGRTPAGTIEIDPGEFVDIDSAAEDIHKAIMPLPFKEPSMALFQLLGFIVDAGKSFAATSETSISDANQNTPVGTTVALLEEGARVFTAIHKRLHNSKKRELKMIAELNYEHMPDRYPFEVEGEYQEVLRNDYDGRVDIIPTSDPKSFSSTQRIALAQTILQLATTNPELHDVREAYERMYKALRVDDIESLLPEPDEALRLDAVAENAAVLIGKPITTFPDQDHMAHMMVHDHWFNMLPPPAQQMFMNVYLSHRAEHMAQFYTVMFAKGLGVPLQAPPTDDKQQYAEVDPQLDAAISMAAAQLVQQAPPMMLGPQLGMPGGGDGQGMEGADALAAAEAERVQIDTMGQAQQQQIKNVNAQYDLFFKQQRHEQDLEQRAEKHELDMAAKMETLQTTIQTMLTKTLADIEASNAKTVTDIEAMIAKSENDAKIARERAKDVAKEKSNTSEVGAGSSS